MIEFITNRFKSIKLHLIYRKKAHKVKMEKEEFLKLLPKLIVEDNEVKGAIVTALSGVMATKSDIERII